MATAIQVLHVDDEPEFGDLVADVLERENDRFEVVTETSAADGLRRVEDEPPDCVVSDYEMPGTDGIEFLDAVRDDHPDLPFILFTGKGSEEIASEAISAGATDYLQKRPGTDQYKLLANRVRNAVQQYRSQRALERERSRITFALESTNAAIWTRDVETDEMEVHPTECPLFGTTIGSVDEWLEQIHPQDRARAEETMRSAARAGESYSLRFRFPDEDGTRWGEMNGRTVLKDGDASFQTGITRDVTAQEERKRRFDTLIRNLPGMVYRCRNDPEWPMEDVRGDVAAFSGYTAVELESNATQWGEEVIHPEDQQAVWETVQESLETGDSFELTYRIRTKDGETRWVWERGRGVFELDGELEALEGFITNVTDRKRRKRELRASERRFESMFNDPNILVGLLETDGTVRDINDTALEYVTADRAEIVGEPFWDSPWWTPDAGDDLRAWIRRAADGEYVEYEAEHPGPDGGEIPVEGTIRPVTDEADRVVSLIVSARDVTDRTQRAAELERIRDRMEFALDRTDSAVWIRDPDTGEMETHPDPCPLFGRSLDDAEEFRECVHPDDRADVEAAVRAAAETGEPRTVQFRTVPGLEADWIELQVRLHTDGESDLLIGLNRDVTEYKRRENRLEGQNEQFDQLASVVSHDLGTPVQTIRGRLELAAETGDADHIDDALRAVDRLDELRDDLAGVLRTKEVVGETETIDVGDLATATWETVDPSDRSTLEVEGTPRMEGDPDATRRLLQNLLSNSVEHAEGPTTVRIGATANGFYLEDDGPGIDPDDRDEVFAPGFTTKPDGTGMGMASVRQIVAEHGWRIGIMDAETLDGTRFEITS